MRDFFNELGIGHAQGVELFKRMKEFLLANPDHQIRSIHLGRLFVRQENERFFTNNGQLYRLAPRQVVALKPPGREGVIVEDSDLPNRIDFDLGFLNEDRIITDRLRVITSPGAASSLAYNNASFGLTNITFLSDELGPNEVMVRIPWHFQMGLPAQTVEDIGDFIIKRNGNTFDVDRLPWSFSLTVDPPPPGPDQFVMVFRRQFPEGGDPSPRQLQWPNVLSARTMMTWMKAQAAKGPARDD